METKAGQCGTGLGVGPPCAFSEDSLVPWAQQRIQGEKTIHELQGSRALEGEPRITVEQRGHKGNAYVIDLNVTNAKNFLY